MNNIAKLKMGITLITAPLIIMLGAYSFAIGNKSMARGLLIFGLINLVGGFAWVLLVKKKRN